MRSRLAALGISLAAALTVSTAPAALAAEGQIDQVVVDDDAVQVLFSLSDLGPGTHTDLASVEASVNGAPVEATAELASDAQSVDRVTVLAIDVSESMAGEPFRQAQSAARAFLDQAPDNVSIAMVSFADDAQVVVQPTLDREAVRSAVDNLALNRNTELYAGVQTALRTLPVDAQGSVLVLSDGRDTSGDPVQVTLDAVEAAEVRVDMVALEQRGQPLRILRSIADAGAGELIAANDPRALTAVFEAQAQVLASQVLVSVATPDAWEGGGATVEVSLRADSETYTDEAYVSIPAVDSQPVAERASEPTEVDSSGLTVSRPLMLAGVGSIALALLLLVLAVSGVLNRRAKESVTDRIAPYGGSANHQVARVAESKGANGGVVQQAVGATQKAINGREFNAKLVTKLEAAGMKLHAAEWVLLHAAIPFAGALVGYLLSGRLLVASILFLAGVVVPHFYLSRKASKRVSRFNAQLGDTLQLIAGSLSAGLSLAQSLDTVVREGSEPVSGEFRRVLVEQRLGVSIEGALDGVAKRMSSDDFAWIVMAIRIQRDVGGNLSELLTTVAATLREREYLRRQVRTLTGEGRISAWILGALPVVFLIYLLLTNPGYLEPMLESTIGWMLLGAAGVMMGLGSLWLSKLVKVKI